MAINQVVILRNEIGDGRFDQFIGVPEGMDKRQAKLVIDELVRAAKANIIDFDFGDVEIAIKAAGFVVLDTIVADEQI